MLNGFRREWAVRDQDFHSGVESLSRQRTKSNGLERVRGEAMQTLPFTAEIYEGLGEVHGLLRLEPQVLVLEYQTKDAVFGIIKSGFKEIRLPLELISSVTLREGWFSTTLEIQTGSLRIWDGFPASKQGRARLKLSKSDRENARTLLAHLDPKSCPLDPDLV